MATITNHNTWEQYTQTSGNIRYTNPETGEDISRRRYDAKVANGTIAKNPNGSTSLNFKTTYFSESRTRHRIINSQLSNATSVRTMVTANKPIGALPSGTSVAIRVSGTLTDTVGNQQQQVVISSRHWTTTNEVVDDYLDVLEQLRNGEVYGAAINFEGDYVEVVFREPVF
ncbi:MAG: hypothetical protein WA919_26385 [Coleofasciculaceae cyanobacterium]